VLSSAAYLIEIRAQAERDSGIDLKLFGFIAESVFTFIPESCSRSPRNGVRNHPGIAFTFLRIPHRGFAQDKTNLIKRLQEQGRFVAMADNGINEAPVLAQVQVGAAMGTGTDVAMESAGVRLVKGTCAGSFARGC
jgi:hypothetical protein